METRKQIKRVLSISALTLLSSLSQCWAGIDGGVGTGGGNPIPAKPHHKPYLPEVEKIISEIRPMARAELNSLRNWYSCDPRNCDSDPFMIARKKLLVNPDKTRNIIDSFNLTLLKDRPCDITNGGVVHHKAASATKPNNICFSLSEIGKYNISSDDINHLRRVMKGLFFHELIHLLDGNETDAVEMQQRIAGTSSGDYDSVYAIYNIPGTADIANSSVRELDKILNAITSSKATDASICSKLSLISSELGRGKRVTLTEKEDWVYSRAITRIGLASKGYCEADDDYKAFFGNKSKLSELEFQLPIANTSADALMKEIEVERANRLSSENVFFNNLLDHSKENLVKEISAAKNELMSSIEALKAMAKF